MNPLDKALGLAPYNPQNDVPTPPKVDAKNAEAEIDEAKDHIISARDLAMQAVQNMLDIAQQSQNSKDYETLNSLIKTYADVSTMPVDLEVKRQKMTGKNTNDDVKQVNNNLFVGSTAELLKMIKGNSDA